MLSVTAGCLRAPRCVVLPLIRIFYVAGLNIILVPAIIMGGTTCPAMGWEGGAVATIIARVMAIAASLSFLHFSHRLID